MLFLHYQAAVDPRIPLMTNYTERTWAAKPAPYVVGPSRSGSQEPVNTDLYPIPKSGHRWIRRLARRAIERVETIVRWVRAKAGRRYEA